MQNLTINTQNVEAWRRLALKGRVPPKLSQFSASTLPGAMEMFATSLALRHQSDLFDEIMQSGLNDDPLWGEICTAWMRNESASVGGDEYGVRVFECFRLRQTEDQTGPQIALFQARLGRSMESRGFPNPFAYAVAGVLAEMTDNVIQHSGRTAEGFTGLAGYYTEDNHVAFAVTDLGRGILARLQDVHEWKHLKSAREALRAVVTQGASSRHGQGSGEGFKQLFQSLSDRNAIIRIRTGDRSLTIADGKNEREGGELGSPVLAGVQVAVSCTLKQRAEEMVMKFPLRRSLR